MNISEEELKKFKNLSRENEDSYINLQPIQRGGVLPPESKKVLLSFGDGYSLCDFCFSGRLDEIETPAVTEFLRLWARFVDMDVSMPTGSSREAKKIAIQQQSRLFDSCEAAQERVRKMIKDHGLNRVVVGGCSPRIYGSSFRKAVERAGMDSFLLEMVNTREHATWVHQDDPPGATSKVIDLVAMGVAKTRELVFDERKQIPMTKAVLIIGGGPSGIIAADNLASQDIKVYLVERESRLGGAINKISRKFLLEDEEIYIGKLEHIIDRFPKNPNVEALTNSQVISVNGFVGNFQVIIESAGKTRQIKVGCIIVATGATQSNDFSNIIMAPSPRVFNQEQFERLLVEGNIGDFKRVGFIQCSNQRVDGKISSNFKNCSGICCKISLKQAIKIHDLNPDAEIHIMQRGMQLSGEVYNEDYHHKVQRFACIERYDPDDYPRVVPGEKGVQVSFKERNTGADLVLDLDAVVLATPYLSASGTEKLAAMLKVPLMQAGFFLEAHVKFRPNDFVVDGMFLAGDAHWPKTLIDAVAHGLGAAARASGFLSKGYINTEENVAEVDLETCIGCGKCADACPFGAISMVSIPIEIEGITIEHQKAHVNEVLCKACGTCVGGCPSFAIDQRNIRKNQLSAMIHALFPQPINKT